MTGPDCEHGHHGALIPHPPIESEDSVEIDYVCTACGSTEYTKYYAREAWQRELEHRQTRERERKRA
jgi:hypothetical protein